MNKYEKKYQDYCQKNKIELRNFITEMRSTSSAINKIAIIKRSSKFIHNVLEATYNPYKQYHITSKTCKKNNELNGYKSFDFLNMETNQELFLEDILYELKHRMVTGHDAIRYVNDFAKYSVYGEFIYRIIDKDLDIRVGASTINKAVPGLIPTFKVALAQEYKGKCDWNDGWYASRKLDGVRCLAVVDEMGKCTLYSRIKKKKKLKQQILLILYLMGRFV